MQKKLAMCQGTNGRIRFASQRNSLGSLGDRTTSHSSESSLSAHALRMQLMRCGSVASSDTGRRSGFEQWL